MLKRVRHDFSSIFFVSQNRKTLQGNPSLVCFTKLPVAKKFLEKRGGCQDFRSKKFCLTVLKKLVDEPLNVSLISGIEIVYASDGYVTIFRRSFFVSQYWEILRWNPSVVCFRKLPVAKKFMDKKGERSIKILRRKNFVSQ